MSKSLTSIVLALFVSPIIGSVHADWSTDAAADNGICTATGEQTQPKIVPDGQGGCYISWFDNRIGGYDVYLQRMDAMGNAMWAANGVLVADRTYSSTQDYGLAADLQGRAILAFRDPRFGGDRVTVAAVNADGSMAWGANGVQVSPSTEFANQPKVGVASNGDVVVAWNGGAATSYVHRIKADGQLAWPTRIAIGGAGTQIASDVKSGGTDGSTIVSVVHYTTFTGAKTLKAQKFAADGTALWGAVTLPVFSTGSLQFGNFPGFVIDDAGGAIFAWYTSSPLQCQAQRLNASGTRLWGTNGVTVTSTSTGVDRTSPDVVFDAATGRTFVTWDQGLPAPSSSNGSAIQAFNAAGVRLWGENGVAVYPMSTTTYDTFWTRVSLLDGQAVASALRWSTATVSTMGSLRFDANGASEWGLNPLPICSATGSQSRPAALGVDGGVVWVWMDFRSGTSDIYAARQNADGSLGPPDNGVLGDIDGDGAVSGSDLALLLSAWGQSGGAAGAADIDGSGLVDAGDLSILLAAWTG
ncbi:MAG: hypothetical protein O2819_04460 [Planctomycetota bacterium]|nr:hypothetical protein [Planctomycetota bacterium]MDA1106508.1 hypothetical protein [Planctomycetota bacterium]